MCMSCQKNRAMGSKISPSRNTYSPKKSVKRTSATRSSMISSFGTPKVKMSFGSRRKG